MLLTLTCAPPQAARDGADWLVRQRTAAVADGPFRYGEVVSLAVPLPGDHLLRQAGAVAALAHAASHWQDLRPALSDARAALQRRAPLTDGCPTLGRCQADPVGYAALRLLADVRGGTVDASTVRYLLERQRPDGSLALGWEAEDADDPAAIDFYAGEALAALAQAAPLAPGLAAPGLAEDIDRCLNAALPFHRRHWRENPSLAFVPWQAAAWDEHHRRTGSPEAAAFVLEMADWLLRFRYTPETPAPPAPPRWHGGFGTHERGWFVRTPPGITAASSLEALCHAVRTADRLGRDEDARRYRRAADEAAAFVRTLQYRRDGHPHLTAATRERLHGAFHAAVDDGSVRIDYAQHAIDALLLHASLPAADAAGS